MLTVSFYTKTEHSFVCIYTKTFYWNYIFKWFILWRPLSTNGYQWFQPNHLIVGFILRWSHWEWRHVPPSCKSLFNQSKTSLGGTPWHCKTVTGADTVDHLLSELFVERSDFGNLVLLRKRYNEGNSTHTGWSVR